MLMVSGPFHCCASCERAAPDAPETIDDPRRFTGGRYRTIYGGSRGSASLPKLPVLTFCERAARDVPKHLRSKALHRMLLSDSLRRTRGSASTGASEVARSYHFYGSDSPDDYGVTASF